MSTTTDSVEAIGNGMQAIANALETTRLPVARSLGAILNAAGVYIAVRTNPTLVRKDVGPLPA